MGRKVFVTYKYSDSQVRDLDIYEENWLGTRSKIQTTARHYVDKLSEILEDDDHIYKGEDDGESLAEFSDDHIASKLRDKIFDSTITVVLVSKGMKSWEAESEQWMPWEISYSLKEITRNGRTSSSNAVIAVVLPDQFGSYDYYLTYDSVCNCISFNTPFLFEILKCNMFNEKNPTKSVCSNGSIVYHGDYSYITSVKWDDFKDSHNNYLGKAVEIRDKKHNYNITKNIRK
jgi:hypothetical protein